MKYLLLFSAIFLLQCSEEDKNPVLATRDRTPLENKVLGAWLWTAPTDKDQINFNSDLTFTGSMNGVSYDGTFTLAGDSILNLVRNIMLKGQNTTEIYAYKLQSVDSAKLVLWSSYRTIIYYKVN